MKPRTETLLFQASRAQLVDEVIRPWLAGGGVRGGVTLGASDDFGFNVTEDRVHVRDLHATILHLLGFDHERLSYRFQGLDQRLTGVEPARVVSEVVG